MSKFTQQWLKNHPVLKSLRCQKQTSERGEAEGLSQCRKNVHVVSIWVPSNLQFFQKGKMQMFDGEFIVFSDDHVDVESGEVRESWHKVQGTFERVIDTEVQICGARGGVLRESDQAEKLVTKKLVTKKLVTKEKLSLQDGREGNFGKIWSHRQDAVRSH